MGCSSSNEKTVNPKIVFLFNSNPISQRSPLPLRHRNSPKQPWTLNPLRSPERKVSNNSTGDRNTTPPFINTFWSTMPVLVVVERLYLLHEETQKSPDIYKRIIEYIRKILNDLSMRFETSDFKCIKKNNKEFKKLIGSYHHGILLMKALGYIDKDDCIEVETNMTVNHAKIKVKEFEHAISKVEKKTHESDCHINTSL